MSKSGDPDAATRTAFRLIGPDSADWVPDRPAGDNRSWAYAKGAPEAIGSLCGLDAGQLDWLHRSVSDMAQDGLRVLGVARATHSSAGSSGLPQRGFAFEFLGLVGFADPLRATVPDAVRECQSAGIRVVMVTGDYPATADAIAAQGWAEDGRHSGRGRGGAPRPCRPGVSPPHRQVFARIMPEQKLRIVEALKADGEVVAMTGDGVNDAPAIKAAHIGIAMGGRGTDVAREASSLVLLDDDFGSIVQTIRLGRRIYDNLRKAMAYIVAVHVPIAGLALLPLLFGLPLDPDADPHRLSGNGDRSGLLDRLRGRAEEDDLMRRPPRPRDSRLFSGTMAAWSLLQGLLAFAVVAASRWWLFRQMPERRIAGSGFRFAGGGQCQPNPCKPLVS